MMIITTLSYSLWFIEWAAHLELACQQIPNMGTYNSQTVLIGVLLWIVLSTTNVVIWSFGWN